MRFFCCAPWAAVAAILLAGCNEQATSNQAASEPAAILDGDWAVVAMQGAEYTATPAELKGMRWSIEGPAIIGSMPNGLSGKMSFKLDPTKTPHEIDITAVDGNRKGETDRCIYSLDERRLRICLANEGSGRPAEFRVSSESWMMELERIRR